MSEKFLFNVHTCVYTHTHRHGYFLFPQQHCKHLICNTKHSFSNNNEKFSQNDLQDSSVFWLILSANFRGCRHSLAGGARARARQHKPTNLRGCHVLWGRQSSRETSANKLWGLFNADYLLQFAASPALGEHLRMKHLSLVFIMLLLRRHHVG